MSYGFAAADGFGETRGSFPPVVAHRMLVLDPETETVICAHNADLRGPIASIQKLLTALLIVEQGGLDTRIEIRPEDTHCQVARAELVAGELHARRDLLACMLIGSANDAALALARDHSGSADAFADAMTERAHDLGMRSSRFCNPNGLPHEDQASTAADAARLAVAAHADPILRELVKTRVFTLPRADGSASTIANTNRLLGATEICDGMKTGFTRASGYCLVASGTARGVRRIVVTLNSTAEAVWSDTQRLLEWSLGTDRAVAGAAHVSP